MLQDLSRGQYVVVVKGHFGDISFQFLPEARSGVIGADGKICRG